MPEILSTARTEKKNIIKKVTMPKISENSKKLLGFKQKDSKPIPHP